MLKLKINSWDWLYLTIILDWFTKEIVGYSLGMQSKTDDWLSVLNIGVNNRFLKGIKDSMKDQLYLVSD